MYKSHRAPRQQSTTACYRTLTIAIFPLMIYALQIVGKFSAIAACASGALVVCKALLELRHLHASSSRQSYPPASRSLLVPVRASVANCYLCKEVRQLWPYQIEGRRVGICRHCHGWTSFSRQHA